MHLHLYRPITWRRGGKCVCLRDTQDVFPREAALLVRLGWATWVVDDRDGMERSGMAGRASPLGEAEKLSVL